MALTICIVLRGGRPVGPGERRLLQSIVDDDRFALGCVTIAPRAAPALSAAVRAVLAVERAVFRVPDQAPPLTQPVVPFDEACAGRYDVIVDFSFNAAVLVLAEKASHGLWRLSSYEDGAGHAATRDRAPVTRVALTRYGPGGVADTIATAAYDAKFLASRNTAFIRELSVQMVVQALARLALTGELARGPVPEPASAPLATADLPGYLLRTTAELVQRVFSAVAERIGGRPGMFYLRLIEGDAIDFDPTSGTDLLPNGNLFWADPFFFEHDGELLLFYEEFDYRTGLGHLAVGRVDGRELVPLGVVLKRPYHLSYPYVFRWGDEILMVPETHAAKRLEVWRATNFPTEWELVSTAFEGASIADTVVFEREGKWWLLTNICQNSYESYASELYLYRIDGPMLNEIEPHPLNPVVIDTMTARGGGRVFERDGRLFRSSQENSHGIYGYGLNVMEIVALDETHYEERLYNRIAPDFGENIMACHHMDSAAGRVVIDMRRKNTSLGRR